MSDAPPVSVLLPVRDAAPFLAEALDSLRAQTHEDFEVLVQDDGSTDASIRIAGRFARDDPRFLLDAGPPRGIVHALNAAAARARGPLFVRMDADDLSVPTRLERLLRAADDHPDAGFLASRVRYLPREGLSEGTLRYEAWINEVRDHAAIVRERFVECPMPHPAWALRREVFESLGGYAEGDFPEDYELFLRAVEADVRFHKVDDMLLEWREGAHRMSRTDDRFSLRAFFELKVRFLVRFLKSQARPVRVEGAGPAGRRWRNRLRAGGLDVSTFEDAGSIGTAFVIATRGRPEGRAETRRLLGNAGLVEGADFLCVQ